MVSVALRRSSNKPAMAARAVWRGGTAFTWSYGVGLRPANGPTSGPTKSTGWISAIREWADTYEVRPSAVRPAERLTCHPEMMYAGRIDLVAHVSNRLSIVEMKTCAPENLDAAIRKPFSHMQAAMLGTAEQICLRRPVAALLLFVTPDRAFTMCEAQATSAGVAASVERYRELSSLQSRLRGPEPTKQNSETIGASRMDSIGTSRTLGTTRRRPATFTRSYTSSRVRGRTRRSMKRSRSDAMAIAETSTRSDALRAGVLPSIVTEDASVRHTFAGVRHRYASVA